MKDDDYGYFGKGFEGYSHYMQTFESTHKKSSGSSYKKTDKHKENQQTNNESSPSLAQKVVILICFFLFIFAFTIFVSCISSGNSGAMLVGVLICLACIAVPILLIKIFF